MHHSPSLRFLRCIPSDEQFNSTLCALGARSVLGVLIFLGQDLGVGWDLVNLDSAVITVSGSLCYPLLVLNRRSSTCKSRQTLFLPRAMHCVRSLGETVENKAFKVSYPPGTCLLIVKDRER